MGNRRLAKGGRSAHKKKIKIAKKSSLAVASGLRTSAGKVTPKRRLTTASVRVVDGVAKTQRKKPNQMEALTKSKSMLLRQQVVEKMVLKEHLRDLEARKDRIRRGDAAKTERRELAKYIRQLKQEQQVKHAAELAEVEAELQRVTEVQEQAQAVRSAAGLNEEEDEWEDVEEAEMAVDDDELQRMFAHLVV